MVIIQTLHHKHIIEVFQVFEVYFFFIWIQNRIHLCRRGPQVY
jgi:hypothetical protein